MPLPKVIKGYDPLSFIHQFLQHLPPKYFQRLRYYGLHWSVTYRKVKAQLIEGLKREGDTIRLLFSILKAMLQKELIICEDCGGTDFEKSEEAPDVGWLKKHVKNYEPKNKAPPNSATYQPISKENTLFSKGESMPTIIEKP